MKLTDFVSKIPGIEFKDSSKSGWMRVRLTRPDEWVMQPGDVPFDPNAPKKLAGGRKTRTQIRNDRKKKSKLKNTIYPNTLNTKELKYKVNMTQRMHTEPAWKTAQGKSLQHRQDNQGSIHQPKNPRVFANTTPGNQGSMDKFPPRGRGVGDTAVSAPSVPTPDPEHRQPPATSRSPRATAKQWPCPPGWKELMDPTTNQTVYLNMTTGQMLVTPKR